MELSKLTIYLIAINVFGFIIAVINSMLSKRNKKQIDFLLRLTAIAGGSIGIIAAFLLTDRKPTKENMMTRVLVACVFVIEIMLYLISKINLSDGVNLNLLGFFTQRTPLLYYLAAINVITFIAFAIDKYNAIKQKSRIRIVTLLALSFFGGSIGALAGIYLLRHKTQKNYFTTGVLLVILMQLVVLFYFMNK